jgi:hypothetical protein
MAKTPVFTSDEAMAALRQTVHGKAANFYAMYSSVLGGIVTDPALMVLPLDDHMVHRGHAVFDTATLTHGMLYQLDPHVDRLIKSSDCARLFWRPRLRAAGAKDPSATGYPPALAATPSVRRNVSAAAST